MAGVWSWWRCIWAVCHPHRSVTGLASCCRHRWRGFGAVGEMHLGCLPSAQICDWAGFMWQAQVAGVWSWWRCIWAVCHPHRSVTGLASCCRHRWRGFGAVGEMHLGCLPSAQICDWAGFMWQAQVAGVWSWWRCIWAVCHPHRSVTGLASCCRHRWRGFGAVGEMHLGYLPPAQICDWAGFMLQAQVAGVWSCWRSQGPL